MQMYTVVTTISRTAGEQLLTYRLMAFGNMGDDCGTGVAFTRDPATGEKKSDGEFLINAQGEDVVAGVQNTACRSLQMEEGIPGGICSVRTGSCNNSGRSLQRYAGYGVYC